MEKKRILPPTYFAIYILVIATMHYILPIFEFLFYPWNLIGLVPLLFGLIINLLADKQFRDSKTTVIPFEDSKKLVVTGLYKFSRNPMYFGMLIILFGESILFGSLSSIIIASTFIFLINIKFIRFEEKMLMTKFNTDYLMYRSSVRRWI